MLTWEQLQSLSRQFDTFAPTDQNPSARIDTGGRPFVAIDGVGALERDDAIRVSRRKKGGFLVEIAIADGTLIPVDSKEYQNALQIGQNKYNWTGTRLIGKPTLGAAAVRSLELTTGTAKHALVISQSYDTETTPDGEPEIYPAQIDVRSMSHKEFSSFYLRTKKSRLDLPILEFNRKFFANRGINGYGEPDTLGGTQDRALFASNLVRTYMVLANAAVAQSAATRGNLLIYRGFANDEQIIDLTDSSSLKALNRADYTTEPMPHIGIQQALGAGDLTFYTHFTSPLRRATDLVNHHLIMSALLGRQLPHELEEVIEFAKRFSGLGRLASGAQVASREAQSV